MEANRYFGVLTTGAAAVAYCDFTNSGRTCAIHTIAKLDDRVPVCRLGKGEHAIARAGVGEAGDRLPGLAVHRDCYIDGFRPSGPHQRLRHAGILPYREFAKRLGGIGNAPKGDREGARHGLQFLTRSAR